MLPLTTEQLVAEYSENTLVVRFTRPEIRNPLSVATLADIDRVLDAVDASDLRAVVFTGTGPSFASGADLREIAELRPGDARDFARRGQRLMSRISGLGQFTIAAVNGFCFGGALDLALACDMRIASPDAKFAHPGAGLGIITGWGGTQRLPRLVGVANALEMFFTASPIDAIHASEIGLVDEIAADCLARSLAIAAEHASSTPL